MSSVSTKITRDHTKKALKLISEGSEIHAVVGVLARDAKDPRSGGATMLDVAKYNEFGTDKMRESFRKRGFSVNDRSYLRSTYDLRERKIAAMYIKLMRSTSGKALEQSFMQTIMGKLGAYVVGQIQMRMASRIPPPNAESTISVKGSDVPLIDDGKLRQSITYEIRDDSNTIKAGR